MINEKIIKEIKGKIGEYLDTYQVNIAEAFEKDKALSVSLPIKFFMKKGRLKVKVGFSMVEAKVKVNCTFDETQGILDI